MSKTSSKYRKFNLKRKLSHPIRSFVIFLKRPVNIQNLQSKTKIFSSYTFIPYISKTSSKYTKFTFTPKYSHPIRSFGKYLKRPSNIQNLHSNENILTLYVHSSYI